MAFLLTGAWWLARGGWLSDSAERTRAFRWENGVRQDLGTLGGSRSEAYGVSADGRVVVGGAEDAFIRTHAFRWENGVMQGLSSPRGGISIVAYPQMAQ
jgi:probable HAF family extracellular repeat protein